MTLVIVNTECANLSSVQFACERLGYQPVISADAAVIRGADKVILPGVGTAKAAMRNLHRLDLVETLQQLTQPLLGICLGMQLLTRRSSEGNVDCLGVIPTATERLVAPGLALPHMGWNPIKVEQASPLLAGVDGLHCYFVHSFAVPVDEYTLASCDYGSKFAAVIQHRNFYGAQFHPERSGAVGSRILQNFLDL